MIKTIPPFIFVAVALFAIGCNGNDKKDAEKQDETSVQKRDVSSEGLEGKSPMNLFPHEVGDQWVYENSAGKEVTFKVSESETVGDTVEFTMEVTVDGKVTDRTEWRLGPKGFYQLSSSMGKKFEPPLPVLTYPISYEKETVYEGTGPLAGTNQRGKQKTAIRSRGVETIDTPLGEMDALAIETITAYKVNDVTVNSTARLWVAPNYGIVRYADSLQASNGQKASSVLKLKSFTGKGQK